MCLDLKIDGTIVLSVRLDKEITNDRITERHLKITSRGVSHEGETVFFNKVFQLLGSVRPSIRPYKTVRSFVNLGRIELTYRAQTFSDFPLAISYLMKSEATL